MWYYCTVTGRQRQSIMAEAAPPDIAGRLAQVRERIARTAQRSGRAPEEIRLVAVSKTVGPAGIAEAIAAGVADFGENYVQEAAAKREHLPQPVRWHLIGHLQRNKAAKATSLFDMVHTVDDPRTAEALGRHAREQGRTCQVLLQVNTSGEPSKFGVAPEALPHLWESVAGVTGVRVQGLMTIGRWDPDPERARPEFRLLAAAARDLARRFGADTTWLSMGMSHDFEVAIEEGANLVRVGSAIFGPRSP
jgi:pyridoxal phosphate enzyme (YggS family)